MLILLGVLGALGYWLFKKVVLLQGELAGLEVLLEAFEKRAQTLVSFTPPRSNAIVRGLREVQVERGALKEALDETKEQRHEQRLERGRELTTADPFQYEHLVKGN
ncbi:MULTISPECIES: hypothetical protein [unclassified Pseudoclavibacter]|uniref:hypothetical protein n=1 Tax=unclassified Pseudoclavibacter TaxID=2615177 RepID=UPI0011AFF342|nr:MULTISPECIES: hypothetical protein [unclassified Pseudoclavibacter]MBF4458728.1 hypothetical protein [Pseudoclavibacter sp. VKM Ac-2867]MBF4548986.1 hypothetical protein [Pseudoclavibacter sp. VKM Ac-2888]